MSLLRGLKTLRVCRMASVAPRALAPRSLRFPLGAPVSVARRAFSTEDDSTARLINSIQQELQEDADKPEFENTILDSWAVSHPEPGLTVLKRTHGEETITVSYGVNDLGEFDVEPDEEGEYSGEEDGENNQLAETDEQGEESDEQDDTIPKVEVEIIIQKGEDGNVLMFEGSAFDVHGFEFTRVMTAPVDGDNDSAYQGPFFNDLAEKLQEDFEDYLTDRLVDGALSQFIVESVLEEEDNSYLNFLKDTKDFLKK
jgi:complement component 1 Q subcomponent-binding protein